MDADVQKTAVEKNKLKPQTPADDSKKTEKDITKKKPKDLTKIHGIVNHTTVKVLSSFGLLLIIGACGYATYKFIDLEHKGIPEYAGLVFMWLGVFAFSYFTIREIIMKDDFFTLASELYHYEPAIYYLFGILSFMFFITFAVMLWSMVTAEPPLGMEYKRHCPMGTKHSDPDKHPSQYS